MRINRYIALATSLSRRAADQAVADGRVKVNGIAPLAGQQVESSDIVTLDGNPITPAANIITILLNKPIGYVCSRNGQGSKTIYDLLPPELHNLKSIGRLDKDSSGITLLTNDGKLAHDLTHPSFQKQKVYEVTLDFALRNEDKSKIETGVQLEDGMSKLRLQATEKGKERKYEVRMAEGRNRQIRRTFAALGYKVKVLHRIRFGNYSLDNLKSGKYKFL